MEIYFVFRMIFVIFSKSFNQAIEAMPEVYFSHTYQVKFFANIVYCLPYRDTIEVYAIRNAYSTLPEDFCIIGESDDCINVFAKLPAEKTVGAEL